jgi:S-methylmethionine-dependent homocysteine/selenocysteine methylase
MSAHKRHCYEKEDVVNSLTLLATSLRETNVDCVMVEMVQNVEYGAEMIRAACLTNKPLIIGFAVELRSDKLYLKDDDVLFTATVVRKMIADACNVACIGVMHSDVSVVEHALKILEGAWKGPLVAYPDVGSFVDNVWQNHADDLAEEHIASKLISLKANHPQLLAVGGCCGLGPSFINKLSKSVGTRMHPSQLIGVSEESSQHSVNRK